MLTEERITDDAMTRFLRVVLHNGLRQRDGVHDTEFPGLTHVEAAKRAGLSRPSVASYAQRLRASVLRNDTLAILPRTGYALAVDFGLNRLARVAISDIHGALVEAQPSDKSQNSELELLARQSPAEALDSAERDLRWLVESHGLDEDQLIGVGVSLPGPVANDVLVGPEAGAWRHLSPADELSRRLQWEGRVGFTTHSDTYLSALAENIWGGGQISDHTLYVKWSTTLRAALIVDGQLYTGHSGTAGQLPHIVIAEDSPEVCEICGQQGCLHAAAPLPALSRVAAGHDRLPAGKLVEHASESAETLSALKSAARGIGAAIAPFVDALNPEVVVIGGALGSRAFPLVLEDVTHGLSELTSSNAENVKLRGSRLQSRTTIRGAIACAVLEFGPSFLRRQVNGSG